MSSQRGGRTWTAWWLARSCLGFQAVRSFPGALLDPASRSAAGVSPVCLTVSSGGGGRRGQRRQGRHLAGTGLAGGGLLHQLWLSVGQVNYPKAADSSSFDEDSSDALSPEQPASHESQGSVPSPLEGRASEPLPSATSVSPTQVSSPLRCFPCSPRAPDLLELPRVRSHLGQVGRGSRRVASAAWVPEMLAVGPVSAALARLPGAASQGDP